MKRFILALGIVGVAIVAIAGASYVVIKYSLDQAILPVRGAPAPFSYEQLEKMMDAKDAPAESDIPLLIACFDKSQDVKNPEDPQVVAMPLGVNASLVLARVGKPAVEPLRARLKDKNAKVRFYSAQTLAWMGPTSAPAADDLIASLKDTDAEVRFKAAYALGQLGLKSDSIIEGLAKTLEDPDGDVSVTAIDSLVKIGAPALPRMYQLVATAKEPARARLIDALEKIGTPPADALPVLAKLVKDPSESVRHPAMKLLAQLARPKDEKERHPAIPTFKELLKKPSPVDLMMLPHAVALLSGDDAKELLPELQVMLIENLWWDAEAELMGTFKKCGPAGAQTLTNILKTLQDPTSAQFPQGMARTAIVLRTLGEMGAEAKGAVPILIELLKERPALQGQILDTLGDIGPAARAAAEPTVQKIAADASNPQLAEKARTALLRMGVIQKKAEK